MFPLCASPEAGTRAYLYLSGRLVWAASVRMAALESRSVEAAIMPVPWNIRLKEKGYNQLIFAGDLLKEPLTGIAASMEKLEKNPQQVKMLLCGFLRSLNAFKRDKKEATEFIGRRFKLEPQAADEVYGIALQTLSDDGTMSQEVLQEFLEQAKKEAGVKKPIALKDIVDERLLKDAAAEVAR